MTCTETLAWAEVGLLAAAFLFGLVVWGTFEAIRSDMEGP